MREQFAVNPPIDNFTGQRKSWTDSMLCFHENIRRRNFFHGYSILTEGVFLAKLSNTVGISF
jgi:hypothetical protein